MLREMEGTGVKMSGWENLFGFYRKLAAVGIGVMSGLECRTTRARLFFQRRAAELNTNDSLAF